MQHCYRDTLTGVENSESYLVNEISLWYESDSKVASEQSLLYAMLRCDSRRFWASLKNYVKFHLDEKLMSPKKGAPVLVKLNRFSGWTATFRISFLENVYSLEQIVNVINLAGFGLGIGSGRNSDYGRYHIIDVR